MTRSRGRPRDSNADGRILSATLEALASVGYEELTIDDVAAKAGVAKTTLYRRWPTKEELVLSCLQEQATQESPPATGDWREDIRRSLEALISQMNTPAGRAYTSVVAAAHNNPGLTLSVSRHDDPVRRSYEALLEGVRSGELRPDLDVDLVMDLLYSVAPFRVMILNEKVTTDLVDRIISIVLDGARNRNGNDSSNKHND